MSAQQTPREHSPVKVDNIVFLNGDDVPQDMLKGIAGGFIGDAELSAAKSSFNAMLARNGRPHGDRHVTTSFGPSLVDLIAYGGGVLRRAPWFGNEGKFVAVEAHGHEIDGWWMQAADSVLLHVPFGAGLTVEETARVLAGSGEPAEALVNYLRAHVNDDRLCSNESVLTLLPDTLHQHLGASFLCGHRMARLHEWCGKGYEEGRVFGLYEAYTWEGCREIEAAHR